MFSNEGLCDNNWHTIKVLREGPRLILQVDNDEPVTGIKFLSNIYAYRYKLSLDHLFNN
jgi:hypothetical protein